MTATPEGAAHLLEGVIVPPCPSSPVSSPDENPCSAPLAALLVASCGAVPAGVPSYAAVVSDLWRDLGGGESHGPVCGLMTASPLGPAHLVEGVIFPPRPSSPLRWWWSFALFGEFLLLRLPSLGCIYIVRVASVVVWRMLCRRRRIG